VPVFRLNDELIFPHPEQADASGLLAVGGDLSPARILFAYTIGVFPWFNDGEPILWWSPDPRFVLEPESFHCSRSLRKTMRQERYRVSCDSAFENVLFGCASTPRHGQKGTWLGPAMRTAYTDLFQLGYAHSVEVWEGHELVGGLYGLALGRCFFGESMFSWRRDASKVALAWLVEQLWTLGFTLVDCQMPTAHLASLGGFGLPRDAYMERLVAAGIEPGKIPDPPEFIPRKEPLIAARP